MLREISFDIDVMPYAEGSCLAKFGKTEVLTSVSLDTSLPRWLRGKKQGWLTAEYSMLPRSTAQRNNRERGKIRGRTQEIQRLIGRSLRSVVNLQALPEVQLIVDCDVLNADGGTRTTAISGAWCALYHALHNLRVQLGVSHRKMSGLLSPCAAISVGIVGDSFVLDLDYEQDSSAGVDMNIVMSDQGRFIELQGTAEQKMFSRDELASLLDLAHEGIEGIFLKQREAVARLK